jgi:gliding motility-associated-like protein
VNSAYTLGNITWSNGISGSVISITETGNYTLYINHLGCETEANISVNFQEFVSLNDLEMPNVFTPNGDLQNKEFRPFLVSNPQLIPCNLSTFKSELIIYNRWGKEISKGDCVWDGNGPAGQTMHDGTYYYLVNLESNCYQRNETRQIAGHVSLLR